MASHFLVRRTFLTLVGLRHKVVGPSPERRELRNQTVARIAFALAYCDGQVHPLEREALAQVVITVYPWIDQTEIMRHFDSFEAQGSQATVLSADDIAHLHERLFAEDLSILPRLMLRIAEAHSGVVPAERALIDSISDALGLKKLV